MAFLDLDEELELLGFSAGGDFVPDYEVVGLRTTVAPGFGRTDARASVEERLRKKRADQKRRYLRRIEGRVGKAYRPRTESRSREEVLERKRDLMRKARARKNMQPHRAFEDQLIEAGLVAKSKVICAGRDVCDSACVPDVARLFSGTSEEEVAARIDFYAFLYDLPQGWSVGRIARFFSGGASTFDEVVDGLRARRRLGAEG